MNSFFLSIFFLQLGSPPPPFFVLMDQFPKKVSKYIIEYKVLQNKIATCFQTLLAFIESGWPLWGVDSLSKSWLFWWKVVWSCFFSALCDFSYKASLLVPMRIRNSCKKGTRLGGLGSTDDVSEVKILSFFFRNWLGDGWQISTHNEPVWSNLLVKFGGSQWRWNCGNSPLGEDSQPWSSHKSTMSNEPKESCSWKRFGWDSTIHIYYLFSKIRIKTVPCTFGDSAFGKIKQLRTLGCLNFLRNSQACRKETPQKS